jgi:hypothetical protein
MRDIMEELIPSERDEQIYAAWESGKTPRVCAREFGVSRMEAERAIDRCLPVFNSKTEMMAYKRERQKLDDIGSKYHAQAMAGDIDSGHLYARINERRCAMAGWTSVNVRLDPYSAQVKEEPSRFEKIHAAIMRVADEAPPAQRAAIKRMEDLGFEKALELLNGNGAALAPPTAPSADDQNRSNSEPFATADDRERDKDAT